MTLLDLKFAFEFSISAFGLNPNPAFLRSGKRKFSEKAVFELKRLYPFPGPSSTPCFPAGPEMSRAPLP